MRHPLKTQAGKKVYPLRKQTVEPMFGFIKSVMGFREFMLRGLDKVGINGSQWRMEYTAVGDTVNTASRPEGMTKTVGYPILVIQATYEATQQRGDKHFGEWHCLSVKGRSQEIEAVELWP